MAAELPTDVPIKQFKDAAAWEKWLAAHRAAPGVWLKIAKKDSGVATVSYPEAIDVALCHGWIDGQKRGFDTAWFLQRFTPRRPRSLWSARNVDTTARPLSPLASSAASWSVGMGTSLLKR